MNAVAHPPCSALPAYVEPMLARAGQPFDDDAFSFEVKWDGTRSICFVDAPGIVRLVNRRKRDMSGRYPEVCDCLRSLPAGTVLDGEIIVPGNDGRPDFQQLQVREQAQNPIGIRKLARSTPATFMVFDQLYANYQPRMSDALRERRERATGAARSCNSPHVVFSDGVIGSGVCYFETVTGRGLEGIVAKRLDSRYAPGKRTDAWVKIKRHEDLACVVIGFVPDEEGRKDFSSLVIAAPGADGALRCVGRVGGGFDEDQRAAVNDFLWNHLAKNPVVSCDYRQARAVEPSLYCTVRCMERTNDGKLRAPVFRGLIDAH